MLAILFPALAALVGLLMFGFAANPKLVRIGELTYFAGILVTLIDLGSHAIHIP